jgi:hypothetical protein
MNNFITLNIVPKDIFRGGQGALREALEKSPGRGQSKNAML